MMPSLEEDDRLSTQQGFTNDCEDRSQAPTEAGALYDCGSLQEK